MREVFSRLRRYSFSKPPARSMSVGAAAASNFDAKWARASRREA
jgi:hypothetical protein